MGDDREGLVVRLHLVHLLRVRDMVGARVMSRASARVKVRVSARVKVRVRGRGRHQWVEPR